MNEDDMNRTTCESRRSIIGTTAACLALGILNCGGPIVEEEDTATPSDPDRIARQAFSYSNHQGTTSHALTNYYNTISVQALRGTSTIGDTGDSSSSDPRYRYSNDYSGTHFDNCYWDEGVGWVNENIGLAVNAAIAFHDSLRSDTYRSDVFKYLGFALHATQDFYAHSNWVESNVAGVVSDFACAKPAGWISGTYYNPRDESDPNPGQLHCPAGTPPHSSDWLRAGMNKDSADRPGYPGSFSEATADAEIATRSLVETFIGKLRRSSANAELILRELGFKHFDVTFILNGESTPSGYYRNPTDLNKGIGGDYIYLCTMSYAQSAPLTVIYGSSPNIACPSDHPNRLNVDLNSGAGGDYIYFCATNAYAGNARVVAGSSIGVSCGTGWTRINLDLNRNAGGNYVYLCIR
jgi:hypothetical protein